MSMQDKPKSGVSLCDRLKKFSQVIYELDPITLKSPHDDEYANEALYIYADYAKVSRSGPNKSLAYNIIRNVFTRQFYNGCIKQDDVEIIAQHLMFIHESRKLNKIYELHCHK